MPTEILRIAIGRGFAPGTYMDARLVRRQLLVVQRLLQRLIGELAHVHLERPGDSPGRCNEAPGTIFARDRHPAHVRFPATLPGGDVGHVEIVRGAAVTAHPGRGFSVGVAFVGAAAEPLYGLPG